MVLTIENDQLARKFQARGVVHMRRRIVIGHKSGARERARAQLSARRAIGSKRREWTDAAVKEAEARRFVVAIKNATVAGKGSSEAGSSCSAAAVPAAP
jgi:hypothetical protein